MAKLWSNEDILGWDDRELLVWHHRINHCSLKSLIRIYKRGIIPRNLSKIRKTSLVSPVSWKVPQEAMVDQRHIINQIIQE